MLPFPPCRNAGITDVLITTSNLKKGLFLLILKSNVSVWGQYWHPWRPEISGPSGAEVTGGCEPFDTGAEN